MNGKVRAPSAGQRGFIGPIGDDLPSLIPIIVSLIIFFSAFTFTFNNFDKRNQELSADRAVLEVARVLQTNGYITGAENFHTLCASLNVSQIKYLAGITNVYTAPGNTQGFNPFEPAFYELDTGDGDKESLECRSPSLPDDFSPVEEFAKNRRVLVKTFPIVVEEHRVVKPMHLVVIAWK